MNCGITCVKYLMFIFNFFFTLAGLGMLVVGVVMKLKVSALSDYLARSFSAPPILLLVVGSIVFVVAFYGCYGAIRENSCMATTYSMFLTALLLVGVTVAIVAFVFKDKVEDILTADFQNAVSNYGNNSFNTEAVDAIQKNLGCCGSSGPRDYSSLASVPKSCCVNKDGAYNDINNEEQVFQTGCVPAMKNFVKGLGTVIGAFAIGVSAIMIVGIVFGLYLARSIRKKERGDFY